MKREKLYFALKLYQKKYFFLINERQYFTERENFFISHSFELNAEECKETSKHLFENLDQFLKLIVSEGNFSPSSCSD